MKFPQSTFDEMRALQEPMMPDTNICPNPPCRGTAHLVSRTDDPIESTEWLCEQCGQQWVEVITDVVRDDGETVRAMAQLLKRREL